MPSRIVEERSSDRQEGLDIPLPEVRQLLNYAETPRSSCGAVDALLDEHIERVGRQLTALTTLERQLVALRRQCKGANSKRSCTIMQTFRSAPSKNACACHPQ